MYLLYLDPFLVVGINQNISFLCWKLLYRVCIIEWVTLKVAYAVWKLWNLLLGLTCILILIPSRVWPLSADFNEGLSYTHSAFLRPFVWVHPGWAGTRKDIHPLAPEKCCGCLSSFRILWGVRKIMEACTPTIHLDATPSGPSMPPPPSSPQFYAGGLMLILIMAGLS